MKQLVLNKCEKMSHDHKGLRPENDFPRQHIDFAPQKPDILSC